MPIVENEAGTLSELIDVVLAVKAGLSGERFLWFRGLNSEAHKLIPKLLRDGKTADQVFNREERLITRFRQQSIPQWPAGYAQSDWEHLFAMQHYGFPTRLLDWSENLFVATFFALYDFATNKATTESPVVWCLDPIGWNRSTPVLSDYGEEIHVLTTVDDELDAYSPHSPKKRPASPVAIFGSHNSERIVSQRGTFTVWGKQMQAMEDIGADYDSLWKVNLTGSPASLMEDLRAMGFYETMIFPELTSLAEELSRAEGWR